jgi:hypothetical protein
MVLALPNAEDGEVHPVDGVEDLAADGGGELDGAAEAGLRPVLFRPGDTRPPAAWTGLVLERLADDPSFSVPRSLSGTG